MRVQHWLTHLFVFMRFQQYFCCKAEACLSPISLGNLLVVSLKVTSYYFNTWCWNVQQMIYCCSDWYLKSFHLKGNRSHFWLNVSCDLNFTVFFFSALYFFPVFTLYHVLSPVVRPPIILLCLVWLIRAASLNRTELTVEVICLRQERRYIDVVVKVGVSYSHPLLSPHRAAHMSLSQGYENKHFSVSKSVSVTAYTLLMHEMFEFFEYHGWDGRVLNGSYFSHG